MKLLICILLAGYASAAAARWAPSQEHEQDSQASGDEAQQDELVLLAQQWLAATDELTRTLLTNANLDVLDMKYYLHDKTSGEVVMIFTYKFPENGRYYTYRCKHASGAASPWRCSAVNWPWVHNEDRVTYQYKPVRLLPVTRTSVATH